MANGDVSEVVRREESAGFGADRYCFLGIGENGHLAFNDPPADFEVEDPYLVSNWTSLPRPAGGRGLVHGSVASSDSRDLYVGAPDSEGERILAVVPDSRKAQAIKACFEGEISPMARLRFSYSCECDGVSDTKSAALLSPALLTSA